MKSIPIVVGITGHRLLRKSDYPLLKERVRTELSQIKGLCPNSSLVLLDSIASGVDSLCAEVALELGYELVVPLPFEQDEYTKDFEGEDLIVFKELINKASKKFELTSLSENNRDHGYLEAGLYIVKHSHILIALWDGGEPKPNGCATAEVVDFAMRGTDESKIVPTPITTIIHIYAPRASAKEIKNVGETTIYENKQSSMFECLFMTDEFNKESINSDYDNSLVDEDTLKGLDVQLSYYNDLYKKADSLSSFYQKKYLSSLKLISLLSSFLALSYLLYDEMELKIMSLVLICLIITVAVYLPTRPKKGKWHEKYLSYRMLAESLRIQFFTFACDVKRNVADLFSWSTREGNNWTYKALKVIEPVEINNLFKDRRVLETWINEQLDYHKKAYKKNDDSLKRNNTYSDVLLLMTVSLYLIVVMLELMFPVFMNKILLTLNNEFLFINKGTELDVRGMFKILTGIVAASALLLANYYGKLSLDNKEDDHKRYTSLYVEANKVLSNPTDELIWELAREELLINSAWLTYSKENDSNFLDIF